MNQTEQQPFESELSAASTAAEVMTDVDLAGATAVVTGGYSGLGLETTRRLAEAGARVIVPARRPDLARTILDGVPRCEVVAMDLSDMDSVRAAATHISACVDKIDILMAVAGVMATPERRIEPGWEAQFTINHLGHFLLVSELYPRLANGGARVVVNSSAGHVLSDIRWHDPHFRTGYDKWLAYGQAKTANALFAVHFDAVGSPDGVRGFSVHPGKIITGLQRDMTLDEQVERGWIDRHGNVIGADFKTVAQGAATGLWAATSPHLDGRGGVYLEDCNVATVSGADDSLDDGGVRKYATDPESAARLWDVSTLATAASPFGGYSR
ncbi:oxidoreductase [Rhodococcus sp. 05-2256-B2]|uniref:SDR family NAD(P)-dependent oxidoreductase n=1 Tax=unclassified Rhodococcus (in: high G+C Gram-positive bacteria) TaxID=192944 RepID=UPI000B9A913B|nr:MULTISPECIES: SDR family NAD(P)-dependent oxidoreductase [unclassified Rhodococcus (in: high G+C Gram-positive bacteria)]OZD88720.1 oxidoreductase [Rhodococcus sp. 05-2256-B4]OZD91800.1 oxidoreductase [Rhodococcus sp. 05-2256-B2]OZD95132.1 oxidoreductase [Rhodococcus sp. 05-2256-B3]OZE02286.1 oxidoreductase [Rhodococcus sp. 05-2256-B1]